MKMRKFDLKRALNGDRVITRCGREVTGLHLFDKKITYPLAGVVAGKSYVDCFTLEGCYDEDNNNHHNDLFMSRVKKEAWINIYRNALVTNFMHESREKAINESSRDNEIVDTIKIEWEE